MAQAAQDHLSEVVGKQLEALAVSLQSGDTRALREYLEVMGRFHTYSVYNQFLILAQMPAATRVAGMRRWNELGRRVQRGARAIRILAPVLGKSGDDFLEGEEQERQRALGFRPATCSTSARPRASPCPRPPQRRGFGASSSPACSRSA